MAMWLFTAAIMDGTPLKLFNNGRLRRDFTLDLRRFRGQVRSWHQGV
jgi:hypothetical protein